MEGETKISEYNEAMFQINRLHEIWVSCRNNRKKGDYPKWKWEMDQAEDELYYDAEELDKKKKDNKFIEKLGEINSKINISSIKLNKNMLYQTLREKERLLRRIQQEAGKGGKYKDTEEDDFD